MKIKETEQSLRRLLNNTLQIVSEYLSSFEGNDNFLSEVKKYNINESFLFDIKNKTIKVKDQTEKLINEKDTERLFKDLRNFLIQDYGPFVDLLKMLFYQIVFYLQNKNIMDLTNSDESIAFSLLGGNYLLIISNYKSLRTTLNQFFFKDITLKDELVVDDRTELWNVGGMTHRLFPSDYYQIREFTRIMTKPVEGKIDSDSFMLLNQQASELLKNAVKHGNKNDINKIVKTWYSFDGEMYKLIIEDEGEGFKDLEKWNEFNRKRNKALLEKDIDAITKLIRYKSSESDEDDGGNALFSALEYWDSGIIFNGKKNKVLAVKYFY